MNSTAKRVPLITGFPVRTASSRTIRSVQFCRGSGCIPLQSFIIQELNRYINIVLYTCRTSGALGGLPRTLLSLKRIGVSCNRFHIPLLWSGRNHQSFSIDISLRWSESTPHSVDISHHWCLGNNLNRFIKLTPLVINVRRRGYALFLRRRLWRARVRERALRRRGAKAGNS